MRMIAALALALLLVGCSQISSLGVEPGENAMACVTGSATPFPGTGSSGVMIDLGNTDTTNYTAEDWIALAEICD
jgi:PBP1b-binding outer membrane lipoprotein LpoB